MKIRIAVLTLSLAAAVLLGACHGVARKTYTQPQAPMRTLGLIAIPKVKEYSLAQLGFRPSMMFGAIGGLVAAAGDAYKQDTVDDAMKLRDFDPAGELERELARLAQAAGYEVIPVGGAMRGKDGFTPNYALLSPRTDLYLDASIASIGFQSASLAAPWQPAMAVPVRLVSGASGEVLYSDSLMVGAGNPLVDSKTIESDPSYTYSSYTDLRDRSDSAIEGLREGIVRVAAQVGRSIGRGTATQITRTDPPSPVLAPPAQSLSAEAQSLSVVERSTAPSEEPSRASVSTPATSPAPAAASPVVAIAAKVKDTAALGRCRPSTVHAMKRDGATEREISGACQASLEAIRTFLR